VKNLEKICENPKHYRQYVNDVSEALFRVGFDEEVGFTSILTLISKIENFGLNEKLNLLAYFTLFPYEKVKD
jgi:hypothetical protein